MLFWNHGLNLVVLSSPLRVCLPGLKAAVGVLSVLLILTLVGWTVLLFRKGVIGQRYKVME